jgi:uncharacterized OsmC-like protein
LTTEKNNENEFGNRSKIYPKQPASQVAGESSLQPDAVSLGKGSQRINKEGDHITDSGWTVRVHLTGDQESKAYSRNQSFAVKKQASFSQEDSHPSAVEYFLGALGGDIVNGYAFQAKKAGIVIEDMELTITGRLSDPLAFLGVVGAEGSPGFHSIQATLYVSADSDKSKLDEVWKSTLKSSPLVNTLQHSINLLLHMQVMAI